MIAIIDTCVIIDVLQKREPFTADSLKIFVGSSSKRFQGVLTAKAITDVHYILRKFTHDETKTRKYIKQLFRIFVVEDTLASDCQNALFADTKDYEDAVMLETAKRIKAGCIITRNLKDYAACSDYGIAVYSPSDFLKIINEQ